MKVIDTKLPGVVVLKPQAYGDELGFFMEASNEGLGIPADYYFVEDNLSYSVKGVLKDVLRRLRLKYPNARGKLVSVQ